MQKKNFQLENVPEGFCLCFNSAYEKCAECLRYQAGLTAAANKAFGLAVYPQACKDGACSMFREARPVVLASGFTTIYDHLTRSQASEAAARVRKKLGNGSYYRYHHGTRLMSPEKQQEVLAILSDYGPTDALHFDRYVEEYDFS